MVIICRLVVEPIYGNVLVGRKHLLAVIYAQAFSFPISFPVASPDSSVVRLLAAGGLRGRSEGERASCKSRAHAASQGGGTGARGTAPYMIHNTQALRLVRVAVIDRRQRD